MKRTFKSRWVVAMLLSFWAMFIPLTAMADCYEEQASNYQVFLSGTDQVTIKVPIFDKGGYDSWVRNGRLFYSVAGESGETMLLFWGVNDGEDDKDIDPSEYTSNRDDWKNYGSDYVYGHLKTSAGGTVYCKIEVDNSEVALEKNKVRREKIYTHSGDNYWVSARWVVPENVRGKKVTFSWKVRRSGHLRYKDNVKGLEDFPITMPDSPPSLDISVSRPIITRENVGKIMVPWIIGTNKVQKVETVYYDIDNKEVTETLPDTTKMGMIPIDAVKPHRSFYIKVDYYNSEGNLVKGKMSTPQSMPMIHAPKNFIATPQNDGTGSVLLSWEMDCLNDEDLIDGDVFEIQRSVTGNEEDYTSLGQEVFDINNSEYSFVDSTLLESFTPSSITEFGKFPTVRYRIRRGATAYWGWKNNPTMATTSASLGTMNLLYPIDAKSELTNKDERTVKVTWNYRSNDPEHWYVWDNRAKMLLTVYMRNQDDQLVDSTVYTLTEKEIREKTKTLNLLRPCIKYDVKLSILDEDTPVGKGGYFSIKSIKDWNTLCRYTLEGGNTGGMVVSLECDLNLVNDDPGSLLGSEEHPFMGIFEGNGHAFNPNDIPRSRPSLFFFASTENATIRNLIVNANFTNRVILSGMVASATNTIIEKCVVNVSFEKFKLASGMVVQGNNVTIKNCLVNVLALKTDDFFNFGGYFITGENCHVINSVLAFQMNVINASNNSQFYAINIGGSCSPDNCYTYSADKSINSTQSTTMYRGRPISSSLLGEYWTTSSTAPNVYPKISNSIEYVFERFSSLVVEGPTYYYEISGKVLKGLEARQLQSSVVLTWDLDGGAVDYCQVLRKTVGGTKFDIIAPEVIGTSYEDKDVSPLEKYEYFVRSAVNCEGTHFEYTDTITGSCKDTGLLEGYVRFVDGTGIPGLTITVTDSEDNLAGTTETDDKGYYKVDNLSYKGQRKIYYTVAVVSTSSLAFEKDKKANTISFDDSSNHCILEDFTVVSGYRFSGYVMYDGTSIPVPGVNFSVNGHDVYASTGDLLETDHSGKFSFYVIGNQQTTIVSKKDGHIFVNNGKYEHYFTDKLSEVHFYDATKVKLVGRMAGGDIQGDLPLDNSLSRNNLGTDLEMVLTLEGDNTSSLVYDNLNPLLTERDTVFVNGHKSSKAEHVTKVHFYRKRMVVNPDETTGEFTLMLPPVKWKVLQAYCNGYGTLFQDGKASEVVDLTDSLTLHTDNYNGSWQDIDGINVTNPNVRYNGIYKCIYHAPIELRYTQLNYDNFDYLGDKNYTAYNQGGDKEIVPLAYNDTVKVKVNNVVKEQVLTKYTFGHPVFNINRPYAFQLSAQERYYWNNNQRSDTIDVVKLNGGTVTIHNSMESSTHSEKVELDSEGIGYVNLKASQISYNLTSNDALRNVTMTLEINGLTCEAEPIEAYILNLYAIPGAKDILNSEKPTLVDILRDPPGGGSYATLSKGSTLKYSYTMDMKWSAGITLDLSSGTGMNNYYGVTTTSPPGGFGPSYGVIQDAKNETAYSNDFTFNGSGSRAYNYTMTATEDIKTSTGGTMVGAPADLYIGVVQNNIVTPAVAIRAVSDSVFQQMVGLLAGGVLPTGDKAKSGRMAEIARGTDKKGNVYHLVRNETLSMGANITSSFIHSQKNILGQIIPELFEQCRSLMFIGTEAEAQKLANSTKKNVYLSLVAPTDSAFAVMNMWKGNPIIYTLKDHHDSKNHKDGMSYVIVKPENYKDTSLEIDEVQKYCGIMYEWIKMIQRNEEEKLAANELVRNFDVDGGSSTTYAENFESQYANTFSTTAPLGISVDNYFSSSGDSYSGGDIVLNAANSFGKVFGPFIVKLLGKIMSSNTVEANGSKDINKGRYTTEVNFTGSRVKFLIYPTLSYSVTPKNTKTETYNRKESFSISMNSASHLNFDVYRTKVMKNDKIKPQDELDVFTNQNMLDQESYEKAFLNRHFNLDNMEEDFYRSPRGFVYRTRGGATAQPWENQRSTIFYNPGTEIDAKTLKIENPKITLDKQSVSGVPFGEPAVFKIYLTNESEAPNAVTYGLSYYTLFLDDSSNPHGAKLMIDGVPLSNDGRSIYAPFGAVTEKTLEVYAGKEFDYENLQIGVMSKGDANIRELVKFDVHFLHTAGPVNISVPGDRWVMNTDAPSNVKGYYLPVKIDGFDRKQPNFDHIEFQYKETARGDDHWTNQCSFYASDTLMAKASGAKAMIPENGYIDTEFYGEQIIMEKAYDLRAVLFIRNGTGFITSTSKVISGIKDTRRPQIFGTPTPSDGVLDIGENIVFDFTEAIEYNYIDHNTDFEVKGEVNNDNIAETVAIDFQGKGSVESEAERNFTGKDLTVSMMVYPKATGEGMPLFSHGKDNKRLQLWLTDDMKLKAVVNEVDNKYISSSPIGSGGFQQVAMVIQQPESNKEPWKLTLYNGGKPIGTFKMDEPYTGSGRLIFGRTNEENRHDQDCRYYTGRMMEARVWYRALTPSQINSYGEKRLTGYEMGLVDYYPMNEGQGNYATDHAQGAHAQIIDASWAIPRTMSLHLDFSDRGMALKKNALKRNKDEDYTLMFWFRTTEEGRGALISNGAGYADDVEAENQFFIGFEGSQLVYRSNGMQIDIPGDYSDDAWHHYAMTVNRARNVANIYMDRTLRATFAADTLGGIIDGYPLLGGTLHMSKKDSLVADTHNWLRGNLDEICLFGQALPLTLISNFSMKCPHGDEAGLLAYLGFNRQELQSDNTFKTVPYEYSQVIYTDREGNVRYVEDPVTKKPTNIPVRDYLFADTVSHAKVLAHIDQEMGAPVRPYEELKNLNFSFVARDNQLLVSIDEPTEYINKRNVYVTVRNIADLNGNSMASPSTMSCFVDCNPLRWSEKTISTYMLYGYSNTYRTSIKNVSGTTHTYKITNCPKWLTVSSPTNTIGPRGEESIVFTINENLNAGTYDEIIYLTDENGLAEPLAFNIEVYDNEPEWTVSNHLRQFSMNIIGRVVMGSLNDYEIITDSRDIVGVFDRKGICHGMAHISYDSDTQSSLLYLTVYNDTTNIGQLYFKLWHYATGKEMLLTNYDNITFATSKLYGSKNQPCMFYADNQYVQTLNLKQGWNWVSFNVYNKNTFDNLDGLLNGFPWKNGDIVTLLSDGGGNDPTGKNNDLTLIYVDDHWKISGNITDNKLPVLPMNSYAVRVQEDITVQLSGYILKSTDDRTIFVDNGWNSIGYTPMMNLPVETALTDYHSYAKDGDIIKSHDEFAVFNADSTGNGRWEGNLKYMRPGEGYMLFHQDDTEVEFVYPFFEPGSIFIDENYKAPAVRVSGLPSTMSLTAIADGITLEPGDRLLAYADGELRGASPMSADSLFFVSISGDRQQGLTFAIEREGEIIATTPELMTFKTNAVVGKPALPTRIAFNRTVDSTERGWYTLEGIKLPSRPTKKGIYIYNGKKRVVE